MLIEAQETSEMKKNSVSFLYLGLGIMQAVHSIEEYLSGFPEFFGIVTSHIHREVGVLPIIHMSEQIFVIVNIMLIVILLVISPFVFQNDLWAVKVAKIVAVGEIVNGIAHLSAAIYFGSYQPGSISAFGLIIIGALLARLLFQKSVRNE